MFLNGGDALSGLGDASQSVRHLVTLYFGCEDTSFFSILQVYCTKIILFYAVQRLNCIKNLHESHDCNATLCTFRSETGGG